MKTAALWLWAVAAALALAVVAARGSGLLWVATASVPRGLWRSADRPLVRGAVVVLCPPDERRFQVAREAGYVPGGSCAGNLPPFVKPVAALPGDVVEVDADGIRVNGGPPLANTRPLAAPGAAEPLRPYPPGRYTVDEGEAWLVSHHHPRSWDSRYYGPVPLSQVRGIAEPIWTFE